MQKNVFSVRGKVVIITGGGGLLGREWARALTRAGARVVIFDTAPQKKTNAYSVVVDITDQKDVRRAVGNVIKKYGRIDVLINGACLNPAPDSSDSTRQWNAYEFYPIDLWKKEFDVGLTGALIATQAVALQMKKQKSGSIINISSIYGLIAPDNRIYDTGKYKSIAYAALKAGLLNFTRAWAGHLGPYNIRVNTVSFGGVFANQNKNFVKKYGERTMLGRMIQKKETVGPIFFLASDASSSMTGANLIIDGGWSAW